MYISFLIAVSDIGNIDFLHFTVGNHQLMCVLDLCWCVMCNADLSFEMMIFSGHVIYLSLLARNREPFVMMNLRVICPALIWLHAVYCYFLMKMKTDQRQISPSK